MTRVRGANRDAGAVRSLYFVAGDILCVSRGTCFESWA